MIGGRFVKPKQPESPEQPEGGKIIVQEEEARKGQVAEEFVGGGWRLGRRFEWRKSGRSCTTH